MGNKVYVKGNIFSTSGYHLGKEFVCGAPEKYSAGAVKVLFGDLQLDSNVHLEPYYMYIAEGDIAVAGGDIAILHSPSSVFDLYNSEIEKIEKLSTLSVPADLQSTFYRQLFIGVIGAFELFMTEILTSLVMGDEQYYHDFIKKTDCKISLKDIELGAPILDQAIYKVIHDINAHNLKKMRSLFKNVFNVEIPDTSRLGRFIEKRHDLVHRSGNSVEDRTLRYIEIPRDELLELIKVSNEFVNGMMAVLEDPIKQWEEDLIID